MNKKANSFDFLKFKTLLFLIPLLIVSMGAHIHGGDSRSYPVTVSYCDGSSLEIYPYSYVTAGEEGSFNCYLAQVATIQGGYRYSFEDQNDYDYNDVIIELYVTGNNTGSPRAYLKYVSKDAGYNHQVHAVVNGSDQMVFDCDGASPGTVFEIPLGTKICGDFNLSVSPASRTVIQGDSAAYTVTLDASGGFNGNVDLSVSGLPADASANFSVDPVAVSSSHQSTLTVTAGATTPAGTYTLTINGQQQQGGEEPSARSVVAGGGNHSAQVTFVVEEPPVGSDFSIQATPTQQEVVQGNSVDYTVSLTALNGFNDNVTLRVDGLPTDATDNFSLNPVPLSTTGQSILTVTTAATTPIGTYSLTITGEKQVQAHGQVVVENHTALVTLKVVAPAPDPDFSLQATPSLQEVIQGSAVDYTVSLSALNGFNGNVGLTVDGLPADASENFSLNPVALSSTGDSTLTITTAATTPTGTYTLTITGTDNSRRVASSVSQGGHTAQVTLKVKAPPVDTDFTIAATPTSAFVYKGEKTSYTLDLASVNGFSDAVSLSVSGLPGGVTHKFSANPVNLDGANGSRAFANRRSARTNGSQAGQSILEITTTEKADSGTYTLTITGQGGGKSHSVNVTLEIAWKPDFEITCNPESQTVIAGKEIDYAVQLTAFKNFTASVVLSVDGLPGNTAALFQPDQVVPDGSSTLRITTAEETPPGIYTLTITGTSGDLVHTKTVQLEVKPVPDFTIKVSPRTINVKAGASGVSTITLTAVNEFSDTVNLSVQGLPAGVTAGFEPASVTPDGQSKLTLSTSPDTPVGSYALVVQGESGGLTRTVGLTLTVTETTVTPDFAITVTPGDVSLLRGEKAFYTVSIKGLNGFKDAVSLSLEKTPEGTAAAFETTTLEPGQETKLELTTSDTTPTGPHTLTIKAEGGGKSRTASVTLTVKCPEFTAAIETETLSGSAPLTVLLKGTATPKSNFPDSAYEYKWDFGDGLTADGQEVEHIFETPGSYTVTLTVTDSCGQSQTALQTIEAVSFAGFITAAFSPGKAAPGETVTLALKVVNSTPQDFENVTIKNVLPALLQYIEDDAPAAVVRVGGNLSWQLPRLGMGETIIINVKVKVSNQAPPGTLTTTATLSHASITEAIQSNAASLTIEKVEAALEKTVDKSEAHPGDTLRYQVRLHNRSSVALSGVDLVDELSTNLEYVSQSVTGGNLRFSRQGRVLRWKGTVDANRTVDIFIEARVKENTFSGTEIENRAEMVAAEINRKIRSPKVRTRVTAQTIAVTNVRFTHKAEVPQTEIGRVIRFNVTVANNSTSALVTPVIEIQLPQGFNYVKGSVLYNNQSFTDPPGRSRLRWELPHLGSNQQASLRYQVVIGADAARGRNLSKAELRTRDTGGQELFYEASAFVNVATSGMVFYSGVEGTVYLDKDGDDFYSMADQPLQGIEVCLSTGQKAVTDTMGHYRFDSLFPGEYAVSVNRFTLPEKLQAVSPVPQVVSLSDGLHDTADFSLKFQNEEEETSTRLEGKFFFDRNGNKVFDAGDQLVEEFEINLDNRLNSLGQNGRFVFGHIAPGEHTIEIRCRGRLVKKILNLKKGDNTIEIPFQIRGITVRIRGEK